MECGGYKKDFKWRPFEETNVKVNIDRLQRGMIIRGSADCSSVPTRASKAGVGRSDVDARIGNSPKHGSATSSKSGSPRIVAMSSQKTTDGEAGGQNHSRPQRDSVLEDVEQATTKGHASSNTGHVKRKQPSPPIDTGSVSPVEELPEMGPPPLVIDDSMSNAASSAFTPAQLQPGVPRMYC